MRHRPQPWCCRKPRRRSLSRPRRSRRQCVRRPRRPSRRHSPRGLLRRLRPCPPVRRTPSGTVPRRMRLPGRKPPPWRCPRHRRPRQPRRRSRARRSRMS
ncbi:hypothetical protein C3942_14915 [Solimonas fluminis]|uniref:Uncharacterized protein n=1 Tax=Solimonas fluminis TaxID=2086571 RepID=A0A2S5TDP8_9GAMM|nr:hypothetical protein C3942_14915 [Solimonas fluminis]